MDVVNILMQQGIMVSFYSLLTYDGTIFLVKMVHHDEVVTMLNEDYDVLFQLKVG